MARRYTNKLLQMIEDGLIDKDTLLDAFLSFMSEDEVKEMMSYNDLIEEDEGE